MRGGKRDRKEPIFASSQTPRSHRLPSLSPILLTHDHVRRSENDERSTPLTEHLLEGSFRLAVRVHGSNAIAGPVRRLAERTAKNLFDGKHEVIPLSISNLKIDKPVTWSVDRKMRSGQSCDVPRSSSRASRSADGAFVSSAAPGDRAHMAGED